MADRCVADAYNWPRLMETEEILARLVALHDEHVEEEWRGVVRWLRPEYQVSRFGDKEEADDGAAPEVAMAETESDDLQWPEHTIDQLTALRAVMGDDPGDVEKIPGQFRGRGGGT